MTPGTLRNGLPDCADAVRKWLALRRISVGKFRASFAQAQQIDSAGAIYLRKSPVGCVIHERSYYAVDTGLAGSSEYPAEAFPPEIADGGVAEVERDSGGRFEASGEIHARARCRVNAGDADGRAGFVAAEQQLDAVEFKLAGNFKVHAA